MTRWLAAVTVAACLTFPVPAAFAQGQSASHARSHGRACGQPASLTWALPGPLDPGARRDWRVTVTEATPLQVDAASEEFDTYLRLADTGGALVAENDDGPESLDSRSVTTLAPGTYCLRLNVSTPPAEARARRRSSRATQDLILRA